MSHGDFDHGPNPALAEMFKQEAERLTRLGANRITAGAPGEVPLFEYGDGEMLVKHMPPDPLGCLRVSIGGVPGEDARYLVFRGDRELVLQLCRRAVEALEKITPRPTPPEEGQDDLFNRG